MDVAQRATLSNSMSADLHDSAVKIHVGYKITSVNEVDPVSCTFHCDIKIYYEWNDPALIDAPLGPVKLGKGIFDPEMVITNECELKEHHKHIELTDNVKGTVHMSVHLKGSLFMMAMDLSTFPFDAQNLQVCLKPHRLPIEKVILLPRRDISKLESHPQHEWKHLSHCAKEYATDPMASTTKKVYSSLHIVVLVQREGMWFVNNIMVVSCSLIMCAMCAFSVDSLDQSLRMEVALHTMLATIENKFIVAEQLPKVPYRTIIDKYLDMSFLTHVLILLSNIVVYYVFDNKSFGWFGEGEHCNYFIFVCLGSAYGLFHLWLWWKLNENALDVQAWKEESEEAGNSDYKSHRRESYFHVAGHAMHYLSHHPQAAAAAIGLSFHEI